MTIRELMRLEGRTAVVTGAAGGIGAVITDALAELGARVLLVDLPGKVTNEQVGGVRTRWSVEASFYPCDLEQEHERERLIAALLRDGPVDILVNNAALVGTTPLQGWAVPFAAQTLATWRRAFEINLTASFHLAQGLYPTLRSHGRGSIVNVSSIYGSYGPDHGLYEGTNMGNPAAYAASKGGLVQLTRWLATTVAPEVRVNCIAPGGVLRGQPDVFVARYALRTPMRRMARETDFAGTIAYLASDLSSYVTGQLIPVDGGWGVW